MSALDALARLLARRSVRIAVLLAACASAIPCGRAMIDLYARLDTDLEALLPKDSPAVSGVRMLRERMAGSQHLGIVIRGRESGPPLAFATALGERLRAFAATRPELVRSVRTDIAEERRFIAKYGALYVPLDALRQIHEDLDDFVAVKRSRLPSLLDYVDTEPGEQSPIEETLGRAAQQDPFVGRFPNDRLVTNDGRIALVLVFLATADTGIDTFGPLVDEVRSDVASLAPAAQGLEVGYAGDVAIAVEELTALKSDIGVSAASVLLGVATAIVLFFRWWGALPAIGLPLAVGTAWGFGIGSLFVHSLCSSTAFLGSIVAGNGINSGIILAARYNDERRRGARPLDAVPIAVRRTWPGTLASAVAASVGYASLLVTSFRGFNEFAVIGSFGMLSCWLATYLLLPITLIALDRRAVVGERASGLAARVGAGIERLVVGRARLVLLVGGGLLLGALVAAAQLDASRIEYDMSKLRSRDSAKNGEAYWSREMNAALGRNFTGVALMSNTAADAEVIASRLRDETTRSPLADVASGVVTPDDMVPPDQPQRRVELRAIERLLAPDIRAALPAGTQASLAFVDAATTAPPLTAAELPELLALGLRERDGTFGRTSIMLQSLNASTWNGQLTIRAAAALRRLAELTKPPAEIAGGFFVSGEILSVLNREALPTTLASFAGVVVVVLALFRARLQALSVLAALLAGVSLLTGAVVLFGMRINFLNFMAFPITFGIGVEYAINMLQRHRENPTDIVAVVSRTGGAVALCSLTTIIGYGSLLTARNQALFSFGVVAVLGEFMCLATAVLLLPAALSRGRSFAPRPDERRTGQSG